MKMPEKPTPAPCRTSSCSAADSLARLSALQDPEKDSEIRAALSSLNWPAWLKPGSLRILYPRSYRPYVENPPTIQHGRLRSGKPRRKLTGLQALYYRYLYELGALPRKPRRPSYAVRQDAYKLNQRIRQMEFLSKHNIDTLEQLETHRKALQTEIGQLQTKRKQLPKTDDVQSQCESVNTALKQLRQEERLCRKIAEHSLEVQQHLTEARRDRAEQQKQEQERARDRRPDITTR